MLQLIADGPETRQRFRTLLEDGQTYVIGRSNDADVPVLWDTAISRRHVSIEVAGDALHVSRVPTATNPLLFRGEHQARCQLHDGDHFVLGSTTFLVVAGDETGEQPPVERVTFDQQTLRHVRFSDADKRIEVLSHLPQVIWGARTEEEFLVRVVNLLLAGIPHADVAAVVGLGDDDEPDVSHWNRRRETAGRFRPSRTLVREALRRGRSVLHVWESRPTRDASSEYTVTGEFDWAFCTSVRTRAGSPWGLYVAGRLDRPVPHAASDMTLQGDVKFTELVAEIIHSLRRLHQLERQQATLRQFFAPPILSALGDDIDTAILEPRECHVTVLFCDLRGFSQQAEVESHDLLGLLDRVSRVFGVVTHEILMHKGVTGDFQGDAALGFWGWPFATEEAPLDACRTALAIRDAIVQNENDPDHPLSAFQMGIGIAHGRAVAGKIGPADHVKVTVFGPVVNLASRLESMTKHLRVPILLDEATTEIVSRSLPSHVGRTRRLARVLPYGMETPVVVSELLPDVGSLPDLTDDHIASFEEGVDHFIAGHWEEAYDCLHRMPASDRAQDFLSVLIAQHNRRAPADWDGIVRLPGK